MSTLGGPSQHPEDPLVVRISHPADMAGVVEEPTPVQPGVKWCDHPRDRDGESKPDDHSDDCPTFAPQQKIQHEDHGRELDPDGYADQEPPPPLADNEAVEHDEKAQNHVDLTQPERM